MVKIVKKAVKEASQSKAELPKITDEIFKMKINRETQQFFIDGLEAYGQFDELTIRPLDILNKIKAYNEDFEVTSESNLYRTLKEATDSKGNSASGKEGKVCGRVVWKNLTDEFSEDEKQENKEKAKFYAFLFGIATIKGQDPILVDMQIGGKKFMEIINLVDKIQKEKGDYNRAEIKVTAHKSEEFDWPELEFTLDFSRELPIDGLSPLLDTVEGYVEYHNSGIEKKAREYLDKKAGKTVNTFKKKTSFKRS